MNYSDCGNFTFCVLPTCSDSLHHQASLCFIMYVEVCEKNREDEDRETKGM